VQYANAVRDTPLLRQIMAGELAFEWTDVTVLYDDPAKTLDATGRTDTLLLTQLLSVMGRPAKSFDLISPYFVPGTEGTEALVALARRGVTVRILTNSLASTDVVPVHAGYAKRRRDLLDAGVQLFELKSSAARDDPSEKAKFGISSSSSLHAKTFAIDRARIFVGSFNFDPRSARLNTEMGLVIESPILAQRLAEQFDTVIPLLAYEVRVAKDGDLEWIDRSATGATTYADEPGATPTVRAWMRLLSELPIDRLM
jgi:putative cardiolipin synthase